MANFLIKIFRKVLFIASFSLVIPFVIIFLTPFKNKIKFVKIRRDVIGNSVEHLYLYLKIYKKNKYHYFFLMMILFAMNISMKFVKKILNLVFLEKQFFIFQLK